MSMRGLLQVIVFFVYYYIDVPYYASVRMRKRGIRYSVFVCLCVCDRLLYRYTDGFKPICVHLM